MDNNHYFRDPKSKMIIVLGAAAIVLLSFWMLTTLWQSPAPVTPSASPSASSNVIPSGDASGFLPTESTLPTPSNSVQPTETETMDTSDWTIEDTSAAYQAGTYRNDKVVSFSYNQEGDTISFGLENGGNSDRIYLNPHASIEEQGRQIGFYITSDRYGIRRSSDNYAPLSDSKNQGHSSFLINKTYDELIPADGLTLGWSNDYLNDGQLNTGTTLHCRAVDLTGGGRILALFTVTIGYENGFFVLQSIQDNDCLVTGELSMEDYQALLSHAYDIAANEHFTPNGYVWNELTQFGEKEAVLYYSRIEYLGDHTYFTKVLDPMRRPYNSYQFLKLCKATDVYAVVLNTNLGHSFVMYYGAPDTDNEYERYINLELESTYTNDNEEVQLPEDVILPEYGPVTSKDLVFFAIELFNPQTRAETGTYFD